MASREFRIALSEAINRDQIKESVFLGLGEARQGVPSPSHPFYPGDQYARKHTQYRPAEANKLLDQLGLTKRDADGTRLLPSGKRVVLELSVVPAFAAWPDVAQLVAKDWEKVGVKTVVQLRERALHFRMRDNNELMTEMWNEDTTGFPFTGNAKFDPRNSPILTLGPLYGRWVTTQGKEGVEPPAPIKRIMEIVDQAKTVGTEQQAKLAQELFRIWVDNLWEVGTVGLTPMVQGVVVANTRLRNVPTTLGNDWPLRSPGNARVEQFFFTR
jgi:peptide/nickel transport system substrate-binding protein